jgi:hypothetical protein
VTPELSGAWEGELVVNDADPALTGCPYMGYVYSTGSSWPAQAEIAQQDAHVDVQFAGSQLLHGVVFHGDLDGDQLHAALDEQEVQLSFRCSPFSNFVAAQGVGGILDASVRDDQIVGTAILTFRNLDLATGQLYGDGFAMPIAVSLRRAPGG